MGRWTQDEYGCIFDEAGCFARLTPNKAERLASRHNADCDAYEARIAELTAKLASVKAESLRVVPDGDVCAAGDARGNHTFIMRGGDVFMSEPHLWDWTRIDGTYAELNDDIFVQPVRLERWEDAE